MTRSKIDVKVGIEKGGDTMYTQNEPLKKVIEKNKVLIAAHRGTNGGNVLQNTCLAYENALLHGADMIEVDVIRSTDGVFFAFHNGEEEHILGSKKDIRQMSSTEIESYCMINAIHQKVSQKVERLEKVLETFKGRCLINIDRSWFYWKETIEYIEHSGMKEQILLKSGVEKELLEQLEQSKSNVMYMPIMKSKDDWEVVKKYDINVAAVEVIFDTLDHWFVSEEFIKELQEYGIYAWVNAITLDDDHVMSGTLDDNYAIENGFENSWGKLMELGFTIIQTDWPALLKGYLMNKVGNH